MIALDTNILLDLLVKNQPNHRRVWGWLKELNAPLVTTQTNIGEILRLITHPRVFPSPLGLKPAVDLLHDFVEAHAVMILEESPSWWQDLPELLKDHPGLKGNEVFDARIALCLRYNGVRNIGTFDADFTKYSFLKMVRPV